MLNYTIENSHNFNLNSLGDQTNDDIEEHRKENEIIFAFSSLLTVLDNMKKFKVKKATIKELVSNFKKKYKISKAEKETLKELLKD